MKTKPMLALAALGVGAVVFSATGRVAAAPNPPQQQDCDRAVNTERIGKRFAHNWIQSGRIRSTRCRRKWQALSPKNKRRWQQH